MFDFGMSRSRELENRAQALRRASDPRLTSSASTHGPKAMSPTRALPRADAVKSRATATLAQRRMARAVVRMALCVASMVVLIMPGNSLRSFLHCGSAGQVQ